MKQSLRRDVWDLLKSNISKGQLAGYMIANIVGLAVVLIGIQFFNDSSTNDGEKETFFTKDYVVLSKKVEGFGFTPINFTKEEINDISSQKWAKNVGAFTPSQFAVYGSVELGGRGLSTYMFLESVPDEFFDIKPEKWDFKPGDSYVPVIINKDYVTLYNFGFAIPQGLPQISEEVISSIPLKVRLTGDDMQPVYLDASVVGFSSRLNTIAVPQKFMDWANNHFAPGVENDPSRLIVEVDRMKGDSMDEYFAKHEIEVAGDNEGKGNIAEFLAVVSSVVTTNGLVICALALFILILSIFLMLQKSRLTLRNLMLLGYSPGEIARYYNIVITSANLIIAIVATTSSLILRGGWNDKLREIGSGNGSLVPLMLVVAAFLVFVTLLDYYVIRTHLRRIWRA